MPKAIEQLNTIRSEGSLLPADLLARVSAEDRTLAGMSAASYHRPGERLNEVISRSWTALQSAWEHFRQEREQSPASAIGAGTTRQRWLLPLFRELGYGRLQAESGAIHIEDRAYPISHSWGLHVPIHLVGYHVDLDRRSRGVTGAAQSSPHSLLQIFLNRSERHLWGFVSNGRKLRLLRDNLTLTRQAYVEFDLEAMLEGEAYSDFRVLWLLCHQSRVEAAGERPSECRLEDWMKEAEQRGTRALELLRDGVKDAISALGGGFLDHPANAALRDKLQSGALPKQDYYRQLLRIVYRLLFMFVAEDRGLLLDRAAAESARELYRQHYSTQRLRAMAADFKGSEHHDLFEALRLVMRLLGGEGSPKMREGLSSPSASPPPDFPSIALGGLGIAPLGSYLFSDRAVPAVIGCKLSNRQLLRAMVALSQMYDKDAGNYRNIDYKNLGPEELGSVYESLLELHPDIHIDRREFTLETAGGNERKTTGSYYTPASLIQALLDSALEPALREARKQGEEAILALKICDPACGSGHFLIAAANRMAKALASLRTGEEEPALLALQAAKRDVISRCIYGVDINADAVELCKIGLWLEALEPGKPLSFLDHHIQVGNSLLGTTPRLLAAGIPDDAFKPIEGDDKKTVRELRKQNRQERKQRAAGVQQLGFEEARETHHSYLRESLHLLADAPDDSLAHIRDKEGFYAALAEDEAYISARLLADAWCAAFVWEKRAPSPPTLNPKAAPHPPAPSPTRREGELSSGGLADSDESPSLILGEGFREGARQGAGGWGQMPLTDRIFRRLEENPLAAHFQGLRQQVAALSDRYGFFHWHIAFPDVFEVPKPLEPADNEAAGWNGGFDVVLGNVPWEHTEIKEKEWFAQRDPDIAKAPGARRKRLIADLRESNPALYKEFAAAKRTADCISHFVRTSGNYPLTGRGRINMYPLFAETDRRLLGRRGRVGMICPSGIATDDTTKFFFQDVMQTQSLASFYDFENRQKLFADVDSRMKFALLTMTGAGIRSLESEFIFFAQQVADLEDGWRRFKLSAADIALLNPNTGTMATFRSQRDAELTKAIYRRVPVLIRETPLQNHWGVSFKQGLFNMTSDSDKFHSREELEARGLKLEGNHFVGREDEADD